MSIQRRIKRLENKSGTDDRQTIIVRWPHEPEPELKPGAVWIKIKWDDDDGEVKSTCLEA